MELTQVKELKGERKKSIMIYYHKKDNSKWNKFLTIIYIMKGE